MFTRVGVAIALGLSAAVVASCGGDSGENPIDTPPAVTSVEVTAPATTLSPAQTVQLTATARSVTGAAVPCSFSWTSSAPTVATVSSSGVVTAVAAGAVIVSARCQTTPTGSIALAVVPAGGTVTTLAVSLSDPALAIGDLGQATVTARDATNAAIALGNRVITWTSTNTAIATVSPGGIISAIGIGSTQIRASVVEGSNTIVGNAALNVVANPDAKQSVDVSMPGLTFSPADVVVKVGGTVRFIFPNMDHNVIWSPRITGSPTDIPILSNQTVSRTFPTAGVFPYVCTLHNGMVGTVVVSP
jgi:plastocyanin